VSNFNEFKEKAKETIDSIAEATQETYKTVESKAKMLARRAKLTAAITKERTIIRRNHIEMGTKYYELFRKKPAKALQENCDAIAAALARIDEMENELKDLV
jgi:polyhydroxyalkanoate synthesis regulator phasin